MYVLNVTYDGSCISLEYTRFLPGTGYTRITDFLYTVPLGNWTALQFSKHDRVDYISFLKTMVFQNLDVHRKLARLALMKYEDAEPYYKLQALNALGILDKTFYAPVINIHCTWQRELLDYMIGPTSIHVISTCRNMGRLDRYFNALQSRIEGAGGEQ
jgi:hypothetical protein